MKRTLLVAIVFLVGCNLYGQNDTSYIHTFGGIQNDGCKQIQPTPDGGYITIGTTNSFGAGNTDFYAIKVDSLCNFQWSRCYGGPQNEEGFSVTTTLDKGYAFVGFTDSYGAGGYDVFLVKTDSMGIPQWQRTYGGSNWDFGYSVKQLPDSGYIICGLTYSYGIGNGNMYIIRTDKNGDTLWTKTAGGIGYSQANALCVLSDSLYAIAGGTTSYGIGEDTNACMVKIKDYGDSGSVISTWIYGKQQNSTFNSIERTYDKGYLLFGSSDSSHDSITPNSFPYEYCPKLDSSGLVQWLQLDNIIPTAAGIGVDAIELRDSAIFALSSNASWGAGEFDFHLQQFQSNGGWVNSVTFGGAKNEIAGSITIGKNGDIVMGGSSESYPIYSVGLFDVFLVRLKSTVTIANGYDTLVSRFIDTTQWSSSIESVQVNIGVKIFPNPVSTSATILVQGNDFEKYTYNLFNSEGQRVIDNYPLTKAGHGQSVAIFNRGSLSAGEYIYEIISNGNNKVATGKIILE